MLRKDWKICENGSQMLYFPTFRTLKFSISVVLVIDWIDETVEFVNLAFAAVLEPIIGAILNGQDIDIFI